MRRVLDRRNSAVLSLCLAAVILPADANAQGIPLNDIRIRCAAKQLLDLLEGNLGALVMIVAGIGTIIACAFGAYRAATSLIAVALGSFVLRSLVLIFFGVDLNAIPSSQCNFPRYSVRIETPPGASPTGVSAGGGIFETFDIFGNKIKIGAAGGGSAGTDGVGGGAGVLLEVNGVPVGTNASVAWDPQRGGWVIGGGGHAGTAGTHGSVGTAGSTADSGSVSTTVSTGNSQGNSTGVSTPIGGVAHGGGSTANGSGQGSVGHTPVGNGSTSNTTGPSGQQNPTAHTSSGGTSTGGAVIR